MVLFPQKFTLEEWGAGVTNGPTEGVEGARALSTGVVNLGSHSGRGHKLTAKFVHSAVEGLGFLGVPVSVVLIIYRSKASQDSDKAWEVQVQTPGGWGEACNGAGAVVAVALPLPQALTSPHKLSPPSPHPRRGSPVREEAVYNAVSQGVHGQRPDLL